MSQARKWGTALHLLGSTPLVRSRSRAIVPAGESGKCSPACLRDGLSPPSRGTPTRLVVALLGGERESQLSTSVNCLQFRKHTFSTITRKRAGLLVIHEAPHAPPRLPFNLGRLKDTPCHLRPRPGHPEQQIFASRSPGGWGGHRPKLQHLGEGPTVESAPPVKEGMPKFSGDTHLTDEISLPAPLQTQSPSKDPDSKPCPVHCRSSCL